MPRRFHSVPVVAAVWVLPAVFVVVAGCGGGEEAPPTNMSATPAAPQDPALPQEKGLASLIEQDGRQGRKTWRRNGILARVARARAEDFARRGYFGAINPDGLGPNEVVRRAGYRLPANYSRDVAANEVESIGAATTDAATVFDAIVARANPRRHLLGETPFFAAQVEYGIGYCHDPNSQYRDYWVVITAAPPTE